ncbi:serine protease [Methylomonas sp. AM2-LC]|uniref:S1 family peptidase n=1 Tax=Methylomonas sp. AM2-LC TaxID=3153301 RepID=UPI0032659A1D
MNYPAKLVSSVFVLFYLHNCQAAENALADLLPRIKPAIVAVGTIQPSRTPPEIFMGTGFVVGDGRSIITNAHVVAKELDVQHLEKFAIFFLQDHKVMMGQADLTATDDNHDLALLTLKGGQLPAMEIGDSNKVREGEVYAFTGYPIGMVLGVHPVTHKGMISAISPSAIPASNSKQLNVKMVKSLKTPFDVFQLDGTAYPGNSGSPLYDPTSGKVIGILDKVFVQGSKENAISNPSGITYAIPAVHIKKLLEVESQPESNQ